MWRHTLNTGSCFYSSSDSDPLFTKFYNKKSVSKSGKHINISKRQHLLIYLLLFWGLLALIDWFLYISESSNQWQKTEEWKQNFEILLEWDDHEGAHVKGENWICRPIAFKSCVQNKTTKQKEEERKLFTSNRTYLYRTRHMAPVRLFIVIMYVWFPLTRLQIVPNNYAL